MGRKYQVISGDGHLETPPDFVKFVPEKWKDRAPRLIRLPDDGGDAWMMEGMPLTYASQNLKGRGTVRVKVVNGAGQPVAGAFVRLQETDFPSHTYEAAVEPANNAKIVGRRATRPLMCRGIVCSREVGLDAECG